MPAITSEQCRKNAESCKENNIKPIMQELKNISKQLNDFKLQIVREIASMPDQLEKKFDDRYADKHTERDLDKLSNTLTKVMWTSITSLIGFLITAIWFLLDKII